MQQRLKSLPRTARAWIVAAELLDQLLLSASDKPQPALDARLAGETLTPLRRPLESRAGRRWRRCVSWSPPVFWLRIGAPKFATAVCQSDVTATRQHHGSRPRT